MFENIEYLIEDLEETKKAIEYHASKFRQAQKAGDTWNCKLLQTSMIQAHGYLVQNFGVQTAAEVDALLHDLKNGNVRARLDSGAQCEKNTTDHLESCLWLSTAP